MPNTSSAWPARADVLQSLSGLLLVLFVWAHMFFESSILLGKDAMYSVSRMFEGEPFFGKPYPLLVSAIGTAIFVLIALHAILALRKFPGNQRQYQHFHSHMRALHHPDTTLWYVQVVTGFCLFFLVSAHLFIVIVQPSNIGPYASSDRIWTGNFWILYALLLLVAHLHAGVGIYRLVLKWGLVPASNFKKPRAQLQVALWCVVTFFICLGSASLITYMKIGHGHAGHAGERYLPRSTIDSPEGT